MRHVTPKTAIAEEIFNNSDLWDLDDMGHEAAQMIIARLERYGFTITPEKIEVER